MEEGSGKRRDIEVPFGPYLERLSPCPDQRRRCKEVLNEKGNFTYLRRNFMTVIKGGGREGGRERESAYKGSMFHFHCPELGFCFM